jgi:hypothetical protein
MFFHYEKILIEAPKTDRQEKIDDQVHLDKILRHHGNKILDLSNTKKTSF